MIFNGGQTKGISSVLFGMQENRLQQIKLSEAAFIILDAKEKVESKERHLKQRKGKEFMKVLEALSLALS